MRESNKAMEEVAAAIKEHEYFAITSHMAPEGDAIGSQLALRLILEELGKESVIINRDPVPANLRFLPGANKILRPFEVKSFAFPVWFVLDCADLTRIGDEIQRQIQIQIQGQGQIIIIINIDHHGDNPRFGEINYVVEAASTSQLIYELAKELGIFINKELATCIYTGIVADTDSFRNSNVDPAVLEIAAELLRAGADAREVAIELYERRSPAEMKLMGHVLINAQIDKGVIWSTISQQLFEKTGTTVNDTERLVEELRAAEGIEVAVLFKELSNYKIKVSLRSKDKIDVNKVAQFFGGGGHEKAAGCLIEGELEEVKVKVLEELQRQLANHREPKTGE